MAIAQITTLPDFTKVPAKRGRSNRSSSGRCLHLIDIENLIGTPRPTVEQVSQCRAEYEQRFLEEGDLVVIAMNHGALFEVQEGWPGVRHEVRSGTDGADLKLLAVIKNERVAERFNTVIIASGDGIFTDASAWLGRQSVMTIVVSRERSLAMSLRLAATKTLYLDLRDEGPDAQVFRFNPRKPNLGPGGQLLSVRELKNLKSAS